MDLTIIQRQNLKSVPSASGIELIENEFYLIGDNSPWLFLLNEKLDLLEKIQIHPLTVLQGDVIPKILKPDFEAMALWHKTTGNELFIFGSGSKSPQRDLCVHLTLGKYRKVNTYPIQSFYSCLKQLASLSDRELNIEAAVIVENELFLFNRGENVIFRLDAEAFLNYLLTKETLPEIRLHRIELPLLQGLKAGFSGATLIPDTKQILFSASVENTENWIDDGEVLGSYVGILDLNLLNDHHLPFCSLLKEHDQVLALKVESVSVKKRLNQHELEILLVTDSDGGISELITADLMMN